MWKLKDVNEVEFIQGYKDNNGIIHSKREDAIAANKAYAEREKIKRIFNNAKQQLANLHGNNSEYRLNHSYYRFEQEMKFKTKSFMDFYNTLKEYVEM